MRPRGTHSPPHLLLRMTLAASMLLASTAPVLATPPATSGGLMPVVQPGDLVEVKVVGYKELNDTYAVDIQGKVDLAVAGPVAVAGFAGEEVITRVREAYWKQLATHPQILVEPKYRVGVLGQVMKPGLFHVSGTETFTDLLAMAGGPGANANLGGARIARPGESVEADLDETLTSGKSILEYGVRSGDMLYVPSKSAWSDWRMWTAVVSSGLLVLNLVQRR